MSPSEHISLLGFAINWEKSSPLPCRQLVYLGMSLDSVTMSAKLSPLWLDAVLSALSRACVGRRVTALSVMRLLLMAVAHSVVPLGLLFMHRLQRWFAHQGLDPRHHKSRALTILKSDYGLRITDYEILATLSAIFNSPLILRRISQHSRPDAHVARGLNVREAGAEAYGLS